MKIETKQTTWSPIKALANAENELRTLNIPQFKTDLSDRDDLEFANLMNHDNR